jgi:hypothetical protein
MNYSNGNCDAKLYAHAQSFCVVMLGKPLCAMAMPLWVMPGKPLCDGNASWQASLFV